MTDAVVDSQESCRDSGWDTLDKNLDAAMDEAADSVDNGSDSVAIISSQGTQASVRATQLHEESQQGHSQDNGGLLSAFDAAMGTFARACMPLVAAPQTPQHAGTQKSSSLSPEDSLDKALQECASPCSNGSDESEDRVQVSLIDISRAYFHAKTSDEHPTYVQLPAEDFDYGKGLCGKLLVHMHGTRRAAQGWHDDYSYVLGSLGFNRGLSSTRLFCYSGRGITSSVHGDDFTSCGSKKNLDWFKAELSNVYELKEEARLGPG